MLSVLIGGLILCVVGANLLSGHRRVRRMERRLAYLLKLLLVLIYAEAILAARAPARGNDIALAATHDEANDFAQQQFHIASYVSILSR